MIALFVDHPIAANSPSACAFLGDAVFFDASVGCVEAPGRDFVGRRSVACCREEGRANRGEAQEPTDRGPDKRPQGAARSVGCFCRAFSLIRQCAASARNVRSALNALPILDFPHLAGAGHG
ncbi:hypothetical protein [Nguyenibacter vanlangensis]|uniref:hypothetical protein n=1 Tax=Nguyenibacter vanlangensis TaxID=1216886 RepID=UPI001C4001B1|nr:hypothetical protein [Nguyenibacter vanlangensis]